MSFITNFLQSNILKYRGGVGMLDHDDKKALQLIELLKMESFGATIGVIGYFVIIKAAQIGIYEEIAKIKDYDIDIEEINLIQEKLSSLGEFLLLIGNSILWLTAVLELKLEIAHKDSSDSHKSLEPQSNIAFGYFLNVISDVIKFTGAQQRVNEAGTEVTIL